MPATSDKAFRGQISNQKKSEFLGLKPSIANMPTLNIAKLDFPGSVPSTHTSQTFGAYSLIPKGCSMPKT